MSLDDFPVDCDHPHRALNFHLPARGPDADYMTHDDTGAGIAGDIDVFCKQDVRSSPIHRSGFRCVRSLTQQLLHLKSCRKVIGALKGLLLAALYSCLARLQNPCLHCSSHTTRYEFVSAAMGREHVWQGFA